MSPFRRALAVLRRPASRRAARRPASRPLGAERFEPRAMLAATILDVNAPEVPETPAVYRVGQTIPFQVTYNEKVTVSQDDPPVAYVDTTRADGTPGIAAFTGIDDTGTILSFLYLVKEGDALNGGSFDVVLGTDNPSTGFPGFLVGGTITTDGDSSPADRSVDDDPGVDPTLATLRPGLTIDGISPTLSSITGPAATYGAGQTVTLTVTFSEPVTVSTTAPTLSLDTGATATLTSPAGVAATTLQFAYLVRPGDVANPLKVTAFNLNGATITDAAGNPPVAPIVGSAVSVTGVEIAAAIAATSPQLSSTAPGTVYSVAPGLIRIVFNTPVRNFTLAALRLLWTPNGAGTPSRIMSLRGASLRQADATGTTWTLSLPRAAVSAKGAYMLVIGGSLSNVRSTAYPTVGMTTPSKLYFKRV